MNGKRACELAGITYRQLDYWASTGIATPTIAAEGSGTQRAYNVEDVVRLSVIKRLLDIGLNLTTVRSVIDEALDCHEHFTLVTQYVTVQVQVQKIRENIESSSKTPQRKHAS